MGLSWVLFKNSAYRVLVEKNPVTYSDRKVSVE